MFWKRSEATWDTHSLRALTIAHTRRTHASAIISGIASHGNSATDSTSDAHVRSSDGATCVSAESHA